MLTDNVDGVLNRTDWALLAKQKAALIKSGSSDAMLDGLLNWLDAIQDAAETEGFPVVWLGGKR